MRYRENLDYGRLPYYIVIGALVVVLLVINYFYFYNHTSSNTETINNYSLRDEDLNKTREAAVAGLFYPADVFQLSNVVDEYLSKVQTTSSLRPHILIVPHAGYQYSAQVAAGAYKKLIPFASEIKTVILVGPSHHVPVRGAALSTAEKFKTPLGRVAVNQELNHRLSGFKGFHFLDNAHRKEHSLEVQLPFLQKVLTRFSIVPIAYGDISPQDLAQALLPFASSPDTVIVISADLSHYLDYDTAKTVDRQTAVQVDNKEPLADHQSCGATGINAALLLSKQLNYQPKLLDMSNSGDSSQEYDSVVGYASWVFNQKDTETQALSPLEQEVENLRNFANHHGKALFDIALQSLQQAVTEHKKYTPSRNDWADVLFNKGAAFVTLTQNGNLRGCIGTLMPYRGIGLDVAENTYAAALHDDRFKPLSVEELPHTNLSISLLTGYEKIDCRDEDDLLNQLQQGIDGLVIRDGNRQGLFLPSVWEQLPDKREFLKNLKLKAGLSPSYWSDEIKAYRFRVVEIKNYEN